MVTTTAPIQDVDSVYLEKTLRHEPMELSLGDTVSLKALAYLAVRAWVASVIFLTVFFTLWILTGGLSSTADSTLNGGGSGDTGLLSVGFVGSWIVFWVVLLFSRMQEPIGEWRVLLADRWEYSGSVYSAVAGVLAARSLPIRPIARRIYADPASLQVKNVLELREGQYTAYVTVFPYGSSLYLGWMMWRRRSGAALVGRMLADMIGSMFGTVDAVRVMLRTDRPRAMREAVHAACREGIYSAVRQEMVADSFGFPAGLPPIEAFELTPAPSPAVPAMPQGGAPVPPAPPQSPAAPVPTAPAPSAYDTAAFEAAPFESAPVESASVGSAPVESAPLAFEAAAPEATPPAQSQTPFGQAAAASADQPHPGGDGVR